MTHDNLGAPAGPVGGRRQSGASPKPNYTLLAIGVALIVLHVFSRTQVESSPVASAAIISLGMTLALYGVYPLKVMRGTFSGILGTLVVAGPAALGVFIFFVSWHSLAADLLAIEKARLAEATALSRADDVLILLVADPTLNKRVVNQEQVALVDVDSFQPDRISGVVQRLVQKLAGAGIPRRTIAVRARTLLLALTEKLYAPAGYQTQLLHAIDLALAGGGDADMIWAAAIVGARNSLGARGDEFLERVKKLPFALVVVSKEKSLRAEILSEGDRLHLGGYDYHVPVIANPKQAVVRNLAEAIVLKR